MAPGSQPGAIEAKIAPPALETIPEEPEAKPVKEEAEFGVPQNE